MLKSHALTENTRNFKDYDDLITSDKLFRSCHQLRQDQLFTLEMLKKMRMEEAMLIKSKTAKKVIKQENPFCNKNLIVKKAIEYEGKEYDMENYKRAKKFFYENQLRSNTANRFKAANKLNMFDEFERKEKDRELKKKIKESRIETQSRMQESTNFMATQESQIKMIINKKPTIKTTLGSRICMCFRKKL